MNITVNPFQQLYFSDDAITGSTFVSLFSDKVFQTAMHPVFQGGNVVLSGTQGCGKTMILNLLRPEIRIAYARENKEFPVPKDMRNFISAGVNLTRSQISNIVQVSLYEDLEADERELALYFADFFNFWVVRDLIASVQKIGENPEVFGSMVNLGLLNDFAKIVAKEDCWFGALNGVETITELKRVIAERVLFYQSWVNGHFGRKPIPESIVQSKTGIGEPIARMANALRSSGVIEDDVPVLIRVDQIEELHRAHTERQKRILLSFRKMLNRAFSARDVRVNYRMGARRYGWADPEFLSIWGSEAKLENRRDYHLIDMDEELFARGEVKNSIFEEFAEDAFFKRVKYYLGDDAKNISHNIAKSIFGKSPLPEERIRFSEDKLSESQIDRALGLDLAMDKGEWSREWRLFLRTLCRKGPAGMLNAVLAAAWGRQTGGGGCTIEHRESPPPKDEPWCKKTWWRKERMGQAVLQLMIRRQQRYIWWGFVDIKNLSDGNISVFLHICHRIWDGFLKKQSRLSEDKRIELLMGGTIDAQTQAAGIQAASNDWFKKLPEEPGGNSRQRFVERLGEFLNESMLKDLKMSYPGGNGISISRAQFESEDEDVVLLRKFMREAVSFGALVEKEHASKTKATGRRVKFYLNNILCPRYQLPERRTKEPFYWDIDELFEMLERADVMLGAKPGVRQKNASSDLPLFPNF